MDNIVFGGAMKHKYDFPTYIIWKRPGSIDRFPGLENLPKFIYQILRILFPPRLFNRWIYQEIWKELDRRKKTIEAFAGKIYPIDIFLPKESYSALSKLYSSSPDDLEISRDLGQWLTEQLMSAWMKKGTQKGNRPELVIRCVVTGDDDQPEFDAIQPMSWREKLARRIEGCLLGIDLPEASPFWIYFPRAVTVKATRVDITNLIDGEEETIERFFPENEADLPITIFDPQKYPLVDEKHATIRAALFSTDKLVMLYLRHIGQHETWVYKGVHSKLVTKLGFWRMAPRDGWMPIVSGNFIVLGRIVEEDDGPYIVPGSMVLRLD